MKKYDAITCSDYERNNKVISYQKFYSKSNFIEGKVAINDKVIKTYSKENIIDGIESLEKNSDRL